jgi:Domain of unknown function (DUF4337)
MSHGPEHQIEHAEHAIHASHDVFNKNVTMSIAIVAAVLACVTMLGHRSHNETLRLQGEALSLQTEASIKSTETANKAGIKSTETANKWAYYQSKNLFNLESEIALDMLKASPAGPHKESKEFQELVARYEDNVEYYMGNKDHRTKKSKKKQAGNGDEPKKGEGKLARIEDEAKSLEKETEAILNKGKAEVEEILKKAEGRIKDSHVEHRKAARLDYGELGLQFAVVLCSLAILTKSRGFWFFGIASGAIGAVVAVTGQFGLFMAEHHH